MLHIVEMIMQGSDQVTCCLLRNIYNCDFYDNSFRFFDFYYVGLFVITMLYCITNDF